MTVFPPRLVVCTAKTGTWKRYVGWRRTHTATFERGFDARYAPMIEKFRLFPDTITPPPPRNAA